EASGQVGPRLATGLDLPYITAIANLEIEANNVKIDNDAEGDVEKIEAPLPLLVTGQQGLNDPRHTSLPGIMTTKEQPLEEMGIDDLDLDEDDLEPKTKTIEIFLPEEKEAGRILEGETEDKVKELVSLLHDDKKVL